MAEPEGTISARRWAAFLWLCDALKAVVAPGEHRAPDWPPDAADTLPLITLAGDHLVTPALAFALQGAAATPPQVREYLAAVTFLNHERNATMLDAIELIATTLARQDIKAVFLKGAGNLADGLYADPAMRLLGDIDVLVPGERAAEAAALLAAAGFSDVDDQPRRLVALRHHHLDLQRHRDSGVGVELHHDLLDPRFGHLLSGDDARANAVAVPFRGGEIHLLSPEHRVAHLAIHDQLSDGSYRRRTCSLRQLLDLALLLERPALDPAAIGADLPAPARRVIDHMIGLAGLLGTPVDVDRTLAAIAWIRPGIERPRGFAGHLTGAYLHRFKTQPASVLNLLVPSRWSTRIPSTLSLLKGCTFFLKLR